MLLLCFCYPYDVLTLSYTVAMPFLYLSVPVNLWAAYLTNSIKGGGGGGGRRERRIPTPLPPRVSLITEISGT